MDWSSIININRLIDIDWYRLISIVIDYRFHRLDTPGLKLLAKSLCKGPTNNLSTNDNDLSYKSRLQRNTLITPSWWHKSIRSRLFKRSIALSIG